MNLEYARLFGYLGVGKAVAPMLKLMASAQTSSVKDAAELAGLNKRYGGDLKDLGQKGSQADRMHYAAMLRFIKTGWTAPMRQRYFKLVDDAMSNSVGGNFYYGTWENLRSDAIARIPAAEKAKLKGLIPEPPPMPQLKNVVPPKGPGQLWTVTAIWEKLAENPKLLEGRDFDNGKNMYAAGACLSCHRFGNEGGVAGPVLSGAGGRYGARDLLVHILTPNVEVSDQYQNAIIKLKSGKVIQGRIHGEDEHALEVMTNIFKPQDLTTIKRSDLAGKPEPIAASPMPSGLLNAMNMDEVLDLVAYLLSSGDRDSKYFKGTAAEAEHRGSDE